MNRTLRIAVGQISSESNHFVPGRCEVEFFRTTGYFYQGAGLFRLRDSATEIGGILATCRAQPGVEVVPLIATRGNSSAVLSARCWRHFKERLLQRLRQAGS